jgi:hypothetical protein
MPPTEQIMLKNGPRGIRYSSQCNKNTNIQHIYPYSYVENCADVTIVRKKLKLYKCIYRYSKYSACFVEFIETSLLAAILICWILEEKEQLLIKY